MPSGKEIVDVVVGETGATADINIWRKQKASLETSQNFQGDKAYVGETLINTPHKKPRQGVLTPAQKRANKSKAQKRIFVEHLIRLLNPHSAVLALMTKDFHTFTVGKISVPTFSNFSIIFLRFWRDIINLNSQIFLNRFLRQYLN